MSKTGKRAKKRKARLKKKLGFLPATLDGKVWGSPQARQDVHGKACRLGTTRVEKQRKMDRKNKQKGWN